jgi:hypothetical protein
MKIQIDLKSALCGLIIGVAAMLVMGAGTTSNQVGKYQIAASAAPNGSFFSVIDTQTGEVWGADSVRDWNNNKANKFWDAK